MPVRALTVGAALLAIAACGAERAEPPAVAPSQRPEAPTQEGRQQVLQTSVESELAQPVSLEIDVLRGNDRWTFVTGIARTPEGEPIDYSQTKFAARLADGAFDDWFCALLESDGAGWSLVALEIGATDVPFIDWPERYGVPVGIVVPAE